MHKIDTETAEDGKFVDEDESQGIAGTDLNAAWFNSTQNELTNIVEGFGEELDDDNDAQILGILKKHGIKAFHVNSSTFSFPQTWDGSSVILCQAQNLTISNHLKKGSVLIVVPAWAENSPESITFTYGGDSATLERGTGFFGICLNGESGIEFSAYKFNVNGSSGQVFSKKVVMKKTSSGTTRSIVIDVDSGMSESDGVSNVMSWTIDGVNSGFLIDKDLGVAEYEEQQTYQGRHAQMTLNAHRMSFVERAAQGSGGTSVAKKVTVGFEGINMTDDGTNVFFNLTNIAALFKIPVNVESNLVANLVEAKSLVYNQTSGMVREIMDGTSSFDLTAVNAVKGTIIVIYNRRSSGDVTVSTGTRQAEVYIPVGCSTQFICVGQNVSDESYMWSPMICKLS